MTNMFSYVAGNLTADPETRTGKNSTTTFTTFSVACGAKDKATFVRCVVFGALGDTIKKYFHKGDNIGVSGFFYEDEYTDKNGNKARSANLKVAGFDFLESKSFKGVGSTIALALTGRLTGDPEYRTTQTGKLVVSVNLAYEETYKKGEENVSNTHFLQVQYWPTDIQLPQYLQDGLKKGSQILVSGYYTMSEYNGKKFGRLTAQNLALLSSPKTAAAPVDPALAGQAAFSAAATDPGQIAPPIAPPPAAASTVSDDELPF